MSHERLTPEEFARLLSLPQYHPERLRAASTPEFEARVRLLREFEAPAPDLLPPDTPAAARELEARVRGNVRESRDDARGRIAPAPLGGQLSPAPREKSGSLLRALVGLFGGTPQRAVAFAGVLAIAITGTWLMTRETPERAVRGADQAAAIEIAAPRATAHGVELSWTPVPGADAYRVVFYASNLEELARVGPVTGTRLELRSDALPAGLRAGTEMLAEVTALRGEDPIATSKPRLLSVR